MVKRRSLTRVRRPRRDVTVTKTELSLLAAFGIGVVSSIVASWVYDAIRKP